MLVNVWLILHRQPLPIWPETLIGATSEIRAQYIAAIIKVDGGGYDDLIAMHGQFAESNTTH